MQELANFVNVLLSYVRYRHWSVIGYESSFWKFFKPDIVCIGIDSLRRNFEKRMDGDYLPEFFFAQMLFTLFGSMSTRAILT